MFEAMLVYIDKYLADALPGEENVKKIENLRSGSQTVFLG